MPANIANPTSDLDIEGKSYRDIATILDITEQQVKVNIFRARQAVREQYLKIEK